MEYTFRDCLFNDYDLLFRLKEENFKKYIEECWGWDLEDQHRRLKEDLELNISRKKIIMVNGNSVGVYATGYLDGDFFIEEINILKEYQNYKIGSRILNNQLEENASKGIVTKLRVFKNNPAKNLYERLGFKVYKEIETHYYMEK
ncbi:MAG: GNAT family N-acetyltransferase [Clostridia bacterium]|nr:GNAT family N-acetyltransferase [Clostridia bacterium]